MCNVFPLQIYSEVGLSPFDSGLQTTDSSSRHVTSRPGSTGCLLVLSQARNGGGFAGVLQATW